LIINPKPREDTFLVVNLFVLLVIDLGEWWHFSDTLLRNDSIGDSKIHITFVVRLVFQLLRISGGMIVVHQSLHGNSFIQSKSLG
jgi:hypothetical protein